MTTTAQREQLDKIVQLGLVIGLYRKLTKAEKEELAGLLGYYYHGKRGPVPEKKKQLPRFGEADFRTPAAYKTLVEKIFECSLPDPQWQEGYPKGRIRSEAVQERKKRRASVYIDTDIATPAMTIFHDLALNDKIIDNDADADALASAINAIIRDCREGRKPALLTPESYEKYGKPMVEKDIVSGMAAILNKHTDKHRTK